MRKYGCLLIVILSGILPSQAQSLEDIELFNITHLSGSGRYAAMGGAFTSLGNDFSSIHLNPAGAAVYRSDNFGLSAALINRKGSYANFFDGNGNSMNMDLRLENAGIVKNWDKINNSHWKISLAFSHNVLADLNRNYTVRGINQLGPLGEGSLADYWLERQLPDSSVGGAIGYTPQQLFDQGLIEEYAAYRTGLLLTDSGRVADIALGSGTNDISQIFYRTEQSGRRNETALSLAAGRADDLFIGFSVGFPHLSFANFETIGESDLPIGAAPFNATSYNLNRYNEIYANGINLRMGIIYKPTQEIRLGASYQSPSWYNVSQIYEISVNTQFSDGSFYESEVFSTGQYQYALRTPSIFRVGGSYIFGKSGLFSLDYEFSNPSKSYLYNDENSFGVDEEYLRNNNQLMSIEYQGRSTIKSGLEYRIKNFFLRGGYNFSQSFYRESDIYLGHLHSISGGIGYKWRSFSIDAAVVNNSWQRRDFVHLFNDLSGTVYPATVQADMSNTNLIVGAQFRF